jgi:hypothetical protein
MIAAHARNRPCLFPPPTLGEGRYGSLAHGSVAVCRAAVFVVSNVQCPHPNRRSSRLEERSYLLSLVIVVPDPWTARRSGASLPSTYVEAHPERIHEDFRVLAVEAMQKTWPCK